MSQLLKDGEYGGENPKIVDNIRKLRLIDDDFLTAVFSDKKLAELLIRIIFDRQDLKVIESHTQYNIKNLFGRSVRLDIYAVDSKGTVYNIEIQKDSDGAAPRRARYNSSLLDAHIIEAGKSVDDLPETYVIFITEKDFFGRGRPIYKIERKIDDNNELFCDGTHIIYVNGENKDDTSLGRLMADFFMTDPEKFYYEELAQAAKYYKYDTEGVHSMCKIIEELVKEEKETAVKNLAVQIARNLIADGTLSLEKIAECSGLTISEVQELAARKPA